MKHVFLLQVHKEPELFKRIFVHLVNPDHYFVINIDYKTEEYDNFASFLSGCKNVFITRMNIIHGGFSQVDCTLKQIQIAYDNIPDFDYIHTLSGQDYPCISMNEFDTFFEHHGTKSYMMLDTEEEHDQWWNGKYRQRLEHWWLYDFFNKKWMLHNPVCKAICVFSKLIPRPYRNLRAVWGGVELV